jgi:hypothetical protein
MNSEHSGSSEQVQILAERATSLQDDLESMRQQRTEAQDTVRE